MVMCFSVELDMRRGRCLVTAGFLAGLAAATLVGAAASAGVFDAEQPSATAH
jgi:hypothetical protein